MRKIWVIVGWLLLCGMARAGGLDIRGWLDRPGTKLLAVEFYATWCEPCMKAVPQWKALHEKYRARGLRLVVVSTMDPEGLCVNPGWMPDETVCDAEGQIAEAFGLQGKLPAAFLWSWQGDLLVGKGHVKEVEKVVEQYLARNPRVTVEVPRGQRKGVELRDLVREQLSSRGKLELVATESEARALDKLKRDSYKLRFEDRLQCELGRELPANSLLRISVASGKKPRFGLMLFAAETGCLLAGSTVPWQAGEARRSVAEAVDKLLSRLRSDLQLPGVVERPAVRKAKDAKRKAQLWLDFAQSPASEFTEDKLKAYSKAIALDPSLSEAYVGRAYSLYLNSAMWGEFGACGKPGEDEKAECLKKYEEQKKRFQKPLNDLEQAIVLDDGNAEAYTMRVMLLNEIRSVESDIAMRKGANDDSGAKYSRRILEDINRAIALDSISKPYLYEQRALLHTIAGKQEKAVADITQAIIYKEAEKPGADDYHGKLPLQEYYMARARMYQGLDKKELAAKDEHKARELNKQRKKALEEKEKEFARLIENSEIKKFNDEVYNGWCERLTGVLPKKEHCWNRYEWRQASTNKITKKIKERIRRGQGTAEEYLFLAIHCRKDGAIAWARYYSEAIRLLKKQATDGRQAMILVKAYVHKAYEDLSQEHFDKALDALNQARAIIDQRQPHALNEFAGLIQARGDPPKELVVSASKLGKEEAEAFIWWQKAVEVGRMRSRIYEKLGLVSKARDVYQYLCSLKDEDACRSLKRLK